MNKTIGEKIRSIRAGKGYSQANVAEDLGMTSGAYAKIERGETDANISRLIQIAKILEVDVKEFFGSGSGRNFTEKENPYGFATKVEVDEIKSSIQLLIREFEKLKSELHPKNSTKKASPSRKKAK